MIKINKQVKGNIATGYSKTTKVVKETNPYYDWYKNNPYWNVVNERKIGEKEEKGLVEKLKFWK